MTDASRRAACMAIFLSATCMARTAQADPLYVFEGTPGPVTVGDARPHVFDRSARGNEFYSEWWSFVFRLQQGYWAYAQLLVTNMGPGDAKAVIRAEIELPRGQRFSYREEFAREKWRFDRQGSDLRIELGDGKAVLEGPLEHLRLTVTGAKGFDARFSFTNIVPPWKPKTGIIQYGENKRRIAAFQLLAPIARVRGEVRIHSTNEVHKVSGVAQIDHNLATVGPHVQARRWLRFRWLNEHGAFFVWGFTPPPEFGDRNVAFMVLFKPGHPPWEDFEPRISESHWMADAEKRGYRAPRLVELSGRDMHAAIKAVKLTSREDYLKTLGRAAALVVSKFVKPVMYYFDAKFAARVKSGGKTFQIGGQGTLYYTVVNP